jgi:hypothetical protein
MLIGHFPQRCPMISDSLAKRDQQVQPRILPPTETTCWQSASSKARLGQASKKEFDDDFCEVRVKFGG